MPSKPTTKIFDVIGAGRSARENVPALVEFVEGL